MRNHLSKVCKRASWMFAVLAACGMATSCQDEFKLDDEKPTWLGASIYDNLKERKEFNYYLRLLADPDVNAAEDADNNRGLVDILSKTGSKTVFVANDEAWEKFFAENALLPESDPWHTATSYDKLSTSQKKLLIHTSMLNNAIVMENLASDEAIKINGVVQPPKRGQYMRRFTDVETTDSITFLPGDQLPKSYNPKEQGNRDFWYRFRAENGGNGLYLVTDSSVPMMLHFTSEHMTNNNITDEDFRIFMGRERVTSDVHIYDALLEEKDGVCQNGYVNVTEKVLKPLANMAEVLRTNGKTNIFSHMIDRWSIPYYNNGVTEAYKKVMAAKGIEWTDSIFTKRYISVRSWNGRELKTDPKGQIFSTEDMALAFDPGWNAYYDEKGNPQLDMAAMYVPNDATLWKYFTRGGGGWQLIQTYCNPDQEYSSTDNPTAEDFQKLYENIDNIPMETLHMLINNIMFGSFASSVPSKMLSLRDEGSQEQIFYPEDIDHVTDALLANNGVIYITDKVYGPAKYTSVAAPANISKTNLVMKWAINNGSPGTTDYMGLNYYAYLLAMQSRFVFFLPSDDALNYYYDAVSFKSTKSRVLQFKNKNKDGSDAGFAIDYKMYAYDPTTGLIGKNYNLEKMTNEEICNRLKDILESHTIVLDGKEELDSDVDEYYVTKNGSAVRVQRENGKIVKVQGGFQLENEEAGITNGERGTIVNGVTDEHRMANGTTYILDSPIIPSAHSVYSVMTNDGSLDRDETNNKYNAFYDLTQLNEEVVKKCGLVPATLTNTEQKAAMKKYMIFTNCPDSKGNPTAPDYNVQFFNNYRYTIFVPTNEAVNKAIAEGLPTWEEINNDYESTLKANLEQQGEVENQIREAELDEDKAALTAKLNALKETAGADSLRLQCKITYLTNFLRYHFVDNSVFVDKSEINNNDYVTASYDNEKGLFCKLIIDRHNSHIKVQDVSGAWVDVDGAVNVMARDIECSKTPTDQKTMNNITIDGSSFAVIHQVTDVLKHDKLSYREHWETPAAARQYLKRFAIR